jgi:uncharacterized membrane protein
MNPPDPTPPDAGFFGSFGLRLGRYFVHGVLILAPIVVTLSLLHWVVFSIDGWLRPYVGLPGVGFLLVMFGVLVIGWIGSFFLIDRLFALFDRWFERVPGLSFIYSSVRDFFQAFVGKKRRFTKAVLVNVLADEVWQVGFLTDEDVTNFNLGAEYVSAYVPQAYNVAGQLYLIKRERIRPIDHLPSADVMKYAVTGGAVDIPSPPPAAKTPPKA